MWGHTVRFTTSCLGILLLSVVLAGCSDPNLAANRALHASDAAVNGVTLPVQGPNTIVCWGDSMTQGDEGTTDIGAYPVLLQSAIGPQIVNMGIGGQTSTQIGVRQGGVASYVTVQGGTIPAHGGVTVRFATGFEPVTLPTRTVSGSIAGVDGTISLSGFLPTGTFNFTPVAGSHTPVTVNGNARFIPATPYQNYLAIFWEGRDNLFATAAGPWGPAQIESDIAAQVAALPKGLNYLVLSVMNENYAAERKGGANYATLMSLNNTLAATYGTHYLDMRSAVVKAYNPSSPVDVTDHKFDMPPTSLGAVSATGTLVGKIGTTDTKFTVKLAAGTLRVSQNLVIDNESIHILSVSGSTVTLCTRGYGGVLAAHSAGAAVTERDPTHLNKQGYTIVATALQSKLATL